MTTAPKAGTPTTELHRWPCLCGAVTCSVSGQMGSISLCHCGRCRRRAGHARAFAVAPRAAIANADPVARVRSGCEAERGFRPHCGASRLWRMDGSDTRSVAPGRHDAPAGLTSETHILASHTGDCCEIEGDLPRSP
ncbi:MAG: hypothetical protein HLUCCA09_00525 [Rhodobacteraceae bacterium HLUCCA09]|nr:MAG: hypothetical protein HLUCCA09_00525 [Rhodobacteraceae bacterium HLUCCA09]